MLVGIFIQESVQEYMRLATDEQKGALEKETNALRRWAEKRNHDVIDVARENRDVDYVYDLDGSAWEVPIIEVVWPLEEVNRDLLLSVDDHVKSVYRKIKKVGFERPSFVMCMSFFECIFEPKNEKKYISDSKSWASVNLVWQRLDSTARIVARLENLDRFGPKVIRQKGGMDIEYGKGVWMSELMRRGLIARKRGRR
jgi:hypothetical protein